MRNISTPIRTEYRVFRAFLRTQPCGICGLNRWYTVGHVARGRVSYGVCDHCYDDVHGLDMQTWLSSDDDAFFAGIEQLRQCAKVRRRKVFRLFRWCSLKERMFAMNFFAFVLCMIFLLIGVTFVMVELAHLFGG